jgi:trehalose-6-phosphate synthase
VEEYQNLRACVNELVGKINGRFGTVDHTPIHYLHRSVPFEELNSMFAMSDACLITSTRDGMNLVRLIVLSWIPADIRSHTSTSRHNNKGMVP